MTLQPVAPKATTRGSTDPINKPSSVFTNPPKIGIRPTIDGRLGGVRESLETQTMDQAKLAAALITSTRRITRPARWIARTNRG